MKRGRIAVVVLGSITAAALAASESATAEEMSLRQAMGENLAGLQTILIALITSNYGSVPDQVAVIRDHAAELTQAVPDSAKEDRDQFLAYAYNLQTHARELKSIVQVLIEHDKQRASGEPLGADQLRAAAAGHYGGMVTMCVACHNRFRQKVVQ